MRALGRKKRYTLRAEDSRGKPPTTMPNPETHDPKPASPPGSNENTNGPLRQYLPRRLDFRTLTQADLDAIAQELNERPRHTLESKTPSQASAEALP